MEDPTFLIKKSVHTCVTAGIFRSEVIARALESCPSKSLRNRETGLYETLTSPGHMIRLYPELISSLKANQASNPSTTAVDHLLHSFSEDSMNQIRSCSKWQSEQEQFRKQFKADYATSTPSLQGFSY